MSAIDDLKRTTCACDIDCLIAKDAILALDSRLTALERTVKDYKEAVDAITAWADGRDREPENGRTNLTAGEHDQ